MSNKYKSNKNVKNVRYKQKYNHIKNSIKNLVIENAALCDEVARIQESIVIAKDERKFLLEKVIEYEEEHESNQTTNKTNSHNTITNGNAKVKRRKSPEKKHNVTVT